MKNKFINIKGRLLDINKPLISGILNITPDSFYDGGRYNSADSAKYQIKKMLGEGADLIDIGAMSSRPGAQVINEDMEWERLKPVLEMIKQDFPKLIFSVDTVRSKIAEKSITEYGAAIINDISGGEIDSNIIKVVAKYNIPYVLMHMRGTPENMQQNSEYMNLITDSIFEISEKIRKLKDFGVNDILIDPGFGFAKNIEQNYELLSNLDSFQIFNLPVYVGLSRKSMAWKHLGISPEESLYATQTLNTIALLKGASIIRVHDVKPAKQLVQIFDKLNSAQKK
jgi:dihydropteroate synthase